MKIQVETLFVSDRDGRLLRVNEPWNPGGNPAPLVFVGLTEAGSVFRFRHDVPTALHDDLEQIVGLGEFTSDEDLVAMSTALKHRLELSGLRVGRSWSGPAYWFAGEPEQVGGCVVIDLSRVELLHEHFSDIIPEMSANAPCVAAVVDGSAVSVCRTVRRSSRAAEAGVGTAADYKRRGLATRVVKHWASIVLKMRLTPLYSTSWDNVASRMLAEKLGLVQYGTDLLLSEHHRRICTYDH